ncbi:uncharacterized protein JCM6883_000420 [Sporobolomyces salmoneus]|uniref:uncharacterized protein n=1 Tax=Sporobolomyces salmoneus TaxID=183962 RepID=UPI00318087AE
MASIRLPVLIAARSIRPSVVLPRALAARSAPIQLPTTSRLLSISAPLHQTLASSAGSGKGGKAEKETAKKAKEQARKVKEKERARKEKEKVKLEKEREKAKAQKEKEKEKLQKEKLKKEKEKEKAKLAAKPKTTSILRPPKLPLTSWGIYLNDYIADRKRNLASGEKIASLPELTKAAGAEYANVDASTKAELQARADEQRAAYPAILEEWKKSLTPEMIKEENAVRANRRKLGLSRKTNLKLEGEPKRPKTAFFLFSSEVRAKGADSEVLQGETRILEQSKRIAEAWRALSEAEKKPYFDTYESDKSRYAREKAEFDAKHSVSS